jgi:hypothetical protein
LERILEVGEGNYLGFVVLFKKEFNEKHTGFKKLYTSFDTKKSIPDEASKEVKDAITTANKKKDIMKTELDRYLLEWEAEIQKQCYTNTNI